VNLISAQVAVERPGEYAVLAKAVPRRADAQFELERRALAAERSGAAPKGYSRRRNQY